MTANFFFLIDGKYRRKRLLYVWWESVGGVFILSLAELHRDAKPKIQVLYMWRKKEERKKEENIYSIEQ